MGSRFRQPGIITMLGVLMLSVVCVTDALAQRGPGGPGHQGGGQGGNPGGGFGRGNPPGFFRAPERGVEPAPPRGEGGPSRFDPVVSMDDAVSMVQARFNATAVKTDRVSDNGQLLYRIRLLSADRSRVWTVHVDAHSGQVQ